MGTLKALQEFFELAENAKPFEAYACPVCAELFLVKTAMILHVESDCKAVKKLRQQIRDEGQV